MIVARRDPFGFAQVLYHPATAAVGPGLRELIRGGSVGSLTVDREAVRAYERRTRLPGRTVLQGFRALLPGHQLRRTPRGLADEACPATPRRGDLEAALVASLRGAGSHGQTIAIALSGGLDSALLLSLLHAHGMRHVPAYILATGMPGYDERVAALATARRLGMEAVVVETSAAAFVAALPDAMHHLDEPLYNLHPVAKLLLAQAMRRDGIDIAISGDGADQVLVRDTSADYLPLARRLFEAAGVRLHAPFLADDVVAHLLSLPPDRDKACLRELGRQYGVPSVLVDGPKRRGLAPAMELGAWLAPASIARHAASVGVATPTLATDAERVHWATLALLLDDLGLG